MCFRSGLASTNIGNAPIHENIQIRAVYQLAGLSIALINIYPSALTFISRATEFAMPNGTPFSAREGGLNCSMCNVVFLFHFFFKFYYALLTFSGMPLSTIVATRLTPLTANELRWLSQWYGLDGRFYLHFAKPTIHK